jgi:uncharacterized membrane protein YfbV (UPF0208 family)
VLGPVYPWPDSENNLTKTTDFKILILPDNRIRAILQKAVYTKYTSYPSIFYPSLATLQTLPHLLPILTSQCVLQLHQNPAPLSKETTVQWRGELKKKIQKIITGIAFFEMQLSLYKPRRHRGKAEIKLHPVLTLTLDEASG